MKTRPNGRDRTAGRLGAASAGSLFGELSVRLRTVLILLTCLFAAPPVTADAQWDFLVFPAVQFRHDSNEDPAGYRGEDDFFPALDLFATVSGDQFQFLGEWYLTEDSQELQRLQFGWRFGSEDTVWLGRYHTPIGYWNSAYHHGAYLQTSITRPGIVEFEGDDGPLPTHFTGLLWEGSRTVDDGGLHYSLALGASPALNGKLDPLDVADPDHDHESGAIINLDWRPSSHDRNLVGVFAGKTEISDRTAQFEHTDQTVVGVYGNWHAEPLRLLGAWYHVENEFHGIQAPDEDFASAYLQVEYLLNRHWTPYARLESAFGEDPDSIYLGRLDGFITRRALVGLRYELTDHQALTVEFSDQDMLATGSRRFIIQWSAYFP